MDLSPAKQTPDVSELSNNDAKVILSVSADKTCCATKFCRKGEFINLMLPRNMIHKHM